MALAQTEAEVQDSLDNIYDKASGTGNKVDTANPDFPWVDLEGLIQPNYTSPGTSPSIGVFQTGVNGLIYNGSDILDCIYHIPHDWVPSSSALIHIHWGNSSALVSGDTFTITPTATYGSRDAGFGTPVTLAPITYTAPGGGLAQYSHTVTEVDLCTVGGSATTLDCMDTEVDGIYMITFVVTTESITGDLFIFTADIHHQSTGIGTKNNASPFYT